MFWSRTNGCTTGLLNFHSILRLGVFLIPIHLPEKQQNRRSDEGVAESLEQIAVFEARSVLNAASGESIFLAT